LCSAARGILQRKVQTALTMLQRLHVCAVIPDWHTSLSPHPFDPGAFAHQR